MIVVVGLGKTGFACAKYFASQGIEVAVTDNRENPPGLAELSRLFPDMNIRCGRFCESLLSAASEIVISPGVPLTEPAIANAIANGKKVVSDIDVFARATDKPIVAITGSNGKSTVTSLVGHMAGVAGVSVQVGGNIGVPVLDLLHEDEPDWYILELSSFQLETTHHLGARIATVLNITPDHLDRHLTLGDYRMAKHCVYQGAAFAVCNKDDPLTWSDDLPRHMTFGLQPTADYHLQEKDGDTYLACHGEPLLATNEMRLKGQHHYLNALAALAMGFEMGLPKESMLAGLLSFPGLRHRCQWVACIDNVDWYNDSKGTNEGATIAAIQGLAKNHHGNLLLIAGGRGKNTDFSMLVDPVNAHIKHAILFGEEASAMQSKLAAVTNTYCVNGLEAAVIAAKNQAKPGDIVLFSPACTSFDMFANFEARGDAFINEVEKLS